MTASARGPDKIFLSASVGEKGRRQSFCGKGTVRTEKMQGYGREFEISWKFFVCFILLLETGSCYVVLTVLNSLCRPG